MAMTRTVIANGIQETVEILYRHYGDENVELTPALLGGLVVCACTIVGGLLDGRYGLLIGGGIGSSINSYIGQRVVTLRQMMQQLDRTQLENLFILLTEKVRMIVVNLIGQVDENLHLTNVLETFGGNLEFRSNILQIIINFYNGIHGDGLSLMAA